MTNHVAYPGCYCADCVEGTPSARITGDKDRENPVEGAPLAEVAASKLRLWFFRECNSGTRRQLFSLFGLPLDEIRNKGAEHLCFNHILDALNGDTALLRRALSFAQGEQVRLMVEHTDGRQAMHRIADAEYADHLSGNENFERLQNIAREGLHDA